MICVGSYLTLPSSKDALGPLPIQLGCGLEALGKQDHTRVPAEPSNLVSLDACTRRGASPRSLARNLCETVTVTHSIATIEDVMSRNHLTVNTPGSYSIVPSAMSEAIADMHDSVKSMQAAIDKRNAPTTKMPSVRAERPTVKMVRLIHPGRV
jgi:hypothetical protein